MKFVLLLLVSSSVYAGDLELSVGVGLSNPSVTSTTWAKPGCCYTIDYQAIQPNQNGSFGVFAGKLEDGVYFLGPTYSYAMGPISFGMAIGPDRDHNNIKIGTVPVIEYEIKHISFDLGYLESTVHSSNGLIFAIGYHF